jgi:hypothetical protein
LLRDDAAASRSSTSSNVSVHFTFGTISDGTRLEEFAVGSDELPARGHDGHTRCLAKNGADQAGRGSGHMLGVVDGQQVPMPRVR